MRRWLLSFALLGCGPAVNSGEVDGEMSSSAGERTETDTSAQGSSDSTGSATSETSSKGSAGSSSSGEPFEMDDVLGPWICAIDEEPFALTIEGYPVPQQLEGQVCANWNGERDPLLWGPCAELTSHPLGGDTELWIYAIIDGDPQGVWMISAVLFYDVETDSMSGFWSGPASEKNGDELSCSRA